MNQTVKEAGRWVPSKEIPADRNVVNLFMRGWNKNGETMYDMVPSHFPIWWRDGFDHSREVEYFIPDKPEPRVDFAKMGPTYRHRPWWRRLLG